MVTRAICMLALIATLVGCASAATYDGHVYHATGIAFHIGAVPAGWRKLESVDGPLLAFEDASRGAAISIYARCGRDGDDVPLSALTGHLLIGFTERDLKRQVKTPLDGREALHTIATAKLDGVPVELGIWVLKKDGCVYDLVYVAPPDRFDDGVAQFDGFVSGFGTGAR